VGCAGIAQLDNYEGPVCELQKMYFIKRARGKGYGTQMIVRCMKRAKSLGYEKMYLETMPNMTDAQRLYQKSGFEYIEERMGDTGHYSCPVLMCRKL